MDPKRSNLPPLPPAATPRAHLVARARRAEARQWPVELPARGLWKVTGEAGSGVSSFLVDTAVKAIADNPARAVAGCEYRGQAGR